MSGWNPKVNAYGDIVSGSGRILLNGEDIGPGWEPNWYSGKDLILFKGADDRPYVMDRHTREVVRQSDETFRYIAAGGGSWMGSRGDIIWAHVSDMGERAWIVEHNGDNNNRSIRFGPAVVLSHQPVNYCYVDTGIVTWTRFGGPRGREVWGQGPDEPIRLIQLSQGIEFKAIPCWTPEGMVVLVQTATELRIARWGTTIGTIIELGADNNLNPDLAWVEAQDGLVVVWNDSQGNLGKTVVPLSTLKDQLVVPPRPDVPPVTGGSMRVRAFPRKVWIAPIYSHHARYGDTPLGAHVGNAIWVGGPNINDELNRIAPLGMPMIVSTEPDVSLTHLDRFAAFWTSGGEIDGLVTNVESALEFLPEKPIIAYLDRQHADDWPVTAPWPTDRVWPAIQAYRNAGEPLSDFQYRIEAMLGRASLWGGYVALVPAFFTRNGQVTPEFIVECMPLYERWMREYDYKIAAFLPFADRRPTGMTEHPILRAWAMAFMDANPVGRPNRGDYWIPKAGVDAVLMNKMLQNVDLHILSPVERARIRMLLIQATQPLPEPEPEPNDPDRPLAPSLEHIVLEVVMQHPEIDMKDEESASGRARVLDLVCQRVGGKPWGRKAREANGGRKNTDALCYLRPDGRFEIYDALNGSNPGPDPDEDPDAEGPRQNWVSWDFKGIFRPGENGYWAPHEPV